MSRTLVYLLLVVTTIGVLAGCREPAIRVWTNSASIAAAIDRFNTSSGRFRAELHYVDSLYTEVRLAEASPDLVVGSEIGALHEQFRNLDGIVDGDPLSRGSFYRRQLEALTIDGALKLLPISFDLPIVVFTAADPFSDSIVVDAETLEALAMEFVEQADGRLQTVGYSPRWNEEFAYEVLRSDGLRFAETPDGITWDSAQLQRSIVRLAGWGEGDWLALEQAFTDRYLYDPPMKLVLGGRTRYYYSQASEFFSMPQETASGLDFRFLGRDGTVWALESQLLAGIPRRAKNEAGARSLLAWLLSEETQTELLQHESSHGPLEFGLLNGFSSLWRVNEEVLPRHYPTLLGRIPSARSLRFPTPAPALWDETKREVILPWIAEALEGRRDVNDLVELVDRWLMQQER